MRVRTPTYNSWRAMMDRCRQKSHQHFRFYGGRGIKVCKRWSEFLNFLADMGERPKGKTLERIDPSKDYKKSNCRWATKIEQARNRRSNVLITAFGETKTAAEWAWDNRVTITMRTFYWRIKNGWPAEEAILTRKQKNGAARAAK